jgi:hypothetical protein
MCLARSSKIHFSGLKIWQINKKKKVNGGKIMSVEHFQSRERTLPFLRWPLSTLEKAF